MTVTRDKYVGVIPAAGDGSRMQPLAFSKELLPLPVTLSEQKVSPVEPISSWLLNSMKMAGVEQVHIVIKASKCDIPAYYGSGSTFGLDLCYHVVEPNQGSPFSINKTYSYTRSNHVVFGFPDIVFYPQDALCQLIEKFEELKNVDVLLGLFDVDDPRKWDTVDWDNSGKIKQIFVKKKNVPENVPAWILAIWSERFSNFMNDFLNNKNEQKLNKEGIRSFNEIYIGDLINLAIENKLKVKGLKFNNSKCLDAGTPEGYQNLGRF